MTVSQDSLHVSNSIVTAAGDKVTCTSVYEVTQGSILGLTSSSSQHLLPLQRAPESSRGTVFLPPFAKIPVIVHIFAVARTYHDVSTIGQALYLTPYSSQAGGQAGGFCTCSVGVAQQPSTTSTFSVEFKNGDSALATVDGEHIHVTQQTPTGAQCVGIYSVTSGNVLGLAAPGDGGGGLSTGALAGIIVAGVIFVVAILVAVVIVVRRKRGRSASVPFSKDDDL